MPGVPKSRGCDTCRQQKKKCDQLTPLCSRCARLGIPCVGSGLRRYKFLSQTVALDQNPESSKQVSITTSQARSSPSAAPPAPTAPSMQGPRATIPVVPSNLATLNAKRFVSALQLTDVRFDLRIYGPFFVDLPRRLGRNQALDASIRALTVSFPAVHTHRYTPDMYKAYGEALASLRISLRDPATVGSVETMCAVYLVMICQGWIGRSGDFAPSHGEAIAHLLSTAAAGADTNWQQDEFAAEVTNTLLFIVILESFGNHKIKLHPKLVAEATPEQPPLVARPNRQPPHVTADDIECLRIPTLATLASYVRDIEGNLPAIQSTYYGPLQRDLAKMKRLLTNNPNPRHVHARRQTRYGTLLLLAILANWALSSHNHSGTVGQDPRGATLELEKADIVDEVIHLAEQASAYRPLAASAMPGFIMAAKTTLITMSPPADHESGVNGRAARRHQQLARLEELLAVYRGDFPAAASYYV
ncbi:hypothetical protein V8F20_010215 [Naviculisporaceae sp. PSN 640]